jgi:hypothetical protein
MNRREAIATLAAVPLFGRLLSGRRYYGPVDVHRHATMRVVDGVFLRVFCSGEDVTERCFFVDDTPGHERADLWRLNADRSRYRDPQTHQTAQETIFGSAVEVRAVPTKEWPK